MSWRVQALGFTLLLSACSPLPPSVTTVSDPQTRATGFDQWQHSQLPGKHATDYVPTREDGREAVAVRADASASMLRRRVHIEPQDLGKLNFSWKVPELIAQADLAQRDTADSPVRIVLAFEGDRSRLSFKDSMLSELAHALTGEPMPYATLMYVWCNTRPPGSVIVNPRTDRIRKLVVESGRSRLNQWLDYERDIRADFMQAFGEPPGALVGMAIMTDSDNTRTVARAWYGLVQHQSPLLAQND
ncbi:DUF3047 domain-containing protein [Curvibacter delicatus]|uniref:DUF3047 domain-containing protein n=1 Tax=Curvibacter delicatus TaxID=80879 RepID=UPI0009FEF3B7|nr:DUF3047 domain-containing protein [Curvibacter delicatus]